MSKARYHNSRAIQKKIIQKLDVNILGFFFKPKLLYECMMKEIFEGELYC